MVSGRCLDVRKNVKGDAEALDGEEQALESDGKALNRQRINGKGRRRSIERQCKVVEDATEALNGDGTALKGD